MAGEEFEIVRVAIVVSSTMTSSLGKWGNCLSFYLKQNVYEPYDICRIFHKVMIKQIYAMLIMVKDVNLERKRPSH